MNEEHITRLKALLTEWNPLGSRSSQIEDLDNYEIEAIDILSLIDKHNTVLQISKMINEVLSQAFKIYVDPARCSVIAEQIHLMLNGK